MTPEELDVRIEVVLRDLNRRPPDECVRLLAACREAEPEVYEIVVGYLAEEPSLLRQAIAFSMPALAKVFREVQTSALALNQQFGPYRIDGELGRGGMGVVYLAVHEQLGKPVALKVLGSLRSEHRTRFQREAKLAAGLRHQNVVPVFDASEIGGLPYYAMDYVQGRGLEKVIEDIRQGAGQWLGLSTSPRLHQQPEFFRRIAELAAQAADAIAHAHGHGIIHRDIKPSNLLLEEKGTLLVVDFGLAFRTDDASLTQTGAILGTPHYMSPEQAQGDVVDHFTDIYSLGATVYELLTLHRPFQEGSPDAVLQQVREVEPDRPAKLNPAIPRDLETIVLKAMAKEPARRYQTAAELAEDLTLLAHPHRSSRLAASGGWLTRRGAFLPRVRRLGR